MMIELLANVKGRVQGVGFRSTAKQLAEKLKLTGFTRNLPDGSVEICVQGEKAQLEKFLSHLRQEFPSDYIDDIDADFRQPSKTFTDFKIVR